MHGLARSALYATVVGSILCGLSACSHSYSPNVYAAGAAQQANAVYRGVIIGVRAVRISANGAVGAVTGGAAGGVAGSQAGPGGFVSALGAIGGTLVGGLAGSAAEKAIEDAKAYEYIVQESGGKLVSVTQSDKEPFAIGTHVLVIAGKQARVVRDYTKPLPAKPKALATTHEAPPIPVQTTTLSAPFVPQPTSPSTPPTVAGLPQAIAPQTSPSPLPGAQALPQAIAPAAHPAPPPAAAELPQAIAPDPRPESPPAQAGGD